MPNVTGQRLDIAENSIKSAGFDGDAKVVGGGTFGVLVKANWQVCKQAPAAGQPVTAAPQLTVDRSCSGSASGSATSPPTSASGEQPSKKPESEPTLTAKNNKDLAALLRVEDPADPRVAAFANKYSGRTIEFDGNIASVLPHGHYKTLEDVLIEAGDYNPNAAIGPNFRLSGVSIHAIPGGWLKGENIRIKATVGEYDSNTQLFELDPFPVTVTARN